MVKQERVPIAPLGMVKQERVLIVPPGHGENIEKIREYLSKNNISKTSDIAEYIGLSLPRTRAILKEIPDVSPIGNNSNRKWTLQK